MRKLRCGEIFRHLIFFIIFSFNLIFRISFLSSPYFCAQIFEFLFRDPFDHIGSHRACIGLWKFLSRVEMIYNEWQSETTDFFAKIWKQDISGPYSLINVHYKHLTCALKSNWRWIFEIWRWIFEIYLDLKFSIKFKPHILIVNNFYV